MSVKTRSRLLRSTLAASAALAVLSAPAASNDSAVVSVGLEVVPIATLEFVGSPLLSLSIPPADSTIPSSGVGFTVRGNANATLVAEPDVFIEIPGQGFLGRADRSGEYVGYKIELRFPKTGVFGSPVQYAPLPGFEPAPTFPPLTVDLTLTGFERAGEIHMEADPYWTPSGGIPLPGLYTGSVQLTLIAD